MWVGAWEVEKAAMAVVCGGGGDETIVPVESGGNTGLKLTRRGR